MKNPRPIQIRTTKQLQLRIVGFRDKESKPYIMLESLAVDAQGISKTLGWVEDRDIKRLLEWCKDCLKKRT